MNIRDLQYLIALHQYKHFGKAADACFVSQPALSMQIKKLEEMLGVQLLERTNKSLMFTEVGEQIVRKSQNILMQVDELREIAQLAKDPFSGQLRVGIIPTLAPYLLPEIMPTLVKAFPKIAFYLIEKQTTQLLQDLKLAEIDVAILALPILQDEFKTISLFEEEFLLAVSKRNPLSKHKFVNAHDLSKQNILLLDEGHCMREQALSFCQRLMVKEAQDFRATSLETLRQMVAADLGVTLMPRLAIKKHDGIVYIPFNKPKPIRHIALCYRATSAKMLLIKELASKIAI